MEDRLHARCLFFPVLLLASAPGCQALHHYRPVAVEAVDAETQQPIPGADVRIWYPLAPPSQAPWYSTGTTGDDGIVRLRAAPFGYGGLAVEGNAKGYLLEQKNLSVEAVHAIAPAHAFEAVDQRPVSVVLAMYAEPRPAVELVVPTGYRGMVKADVQVQEGASCPPGQRCFSYAVPPSGDVEVIGPAMLKRVDPPSFRARYADGTPLGRPDKDYAAVGFWWMKSEGRCQFFLVGTRSEYESMCRSYDKEGTGEYRISGGGKGQGGGRGGRDHGGNQAPSQSSSDGTMP